MDANWFADPSGRHELRYWNGTQWSEHVSDAGVQSLDPLDASSPEQAVEAPPSNTPTSGLSGDLIGGQYAEVDGSGPLKQNAKMLRVRLGGPFMAKQGSMVAYQGHVDFAYKGGGVAKVLKKAMTGEGVNLMTVSGSGDVFLADRAADVHILNLDNGGISVSGARILAFDAGLQWDIERVRGAGMVTGGLFNTTLRGTGWVAITTDGTPVVLNAGEAPTFADTNAVVAWSLGLTTGLRTSVKVGDLVGRGSGEAFQMSFAGQGFVIVQPSEGVALASG